MKVSSFLLSLSLASSLLWAQSENFIGDSSRTSPTGTTIKYLHDGRTVEYTEAEHENPTDSLSHKPKTKLNHPVAIGVAISLVGLVLMMGAAGEGMNSAWENPNQTQQERDASRTKGNILGISGITFLIGGVLYATVGGIYNSTIPDTLSKDSGAQNFGASHDSIGKDVPLTTTPTDVSAATATEKTEAHVNSDPQKPKQRLWHPILVGMGITAIGVAVARIQTGRNAYGEEKHPLEPTGTIIALGGIGYAIYGGFHNAFLPEDKAKKNSARHFGAFPALSFTPTGKLQPGVMAWARF